MAENTEFQLESLDTLNNSLNVHQEQTNPVEDPPSTKTKAQTFLETSNYFLTKEKQSSINKNADLFRSVDTPGSFSKRYTGQDYGYNPERDNEDFYAKGQSWYTEIPKGLAKGVGLVGTKTLTGIGFTLGLINPVNWGADDGYIAAAGDNAISTAFQGLEDKIKQDWAPTFQEASDRNKGFFSRAFTDLNFWTEDVVDGAAFMASAFIPGMALSKLGAGMKVAQIASAARLGINSAEAVVEGTVAAQNYLANAQKIAKGFDAFTTWATATASESMYEANDVRKNVLTSLDGKINDKTGQVYTDQEKKEIAAGAARNTFLMNAALLGATNALSLNYLYKALGKTAPGASSIVQAGGIGTAFAEDIATTKVGKFLASNTGKALKGAGVGILSEGYIEENTQLAIQRMNQEYGAQGKIAGILDYGEVITRSAKQIVDATMGDDPEAAMSIGLGGLLGGGMSAVGDYKENKRERITTDSAISLLNKTQESWLKFNNIYQTEDVVIKNEQGDDIVTTRNVLDKNGNLVEDPEKVASIIAGAKNNIDQLATSDIAATPEERNYLKYSAFADYVQAHINAGIEDTLADKLSTANLATPDALAAMGLDPNSKESGEFSVYQNLANKIIDQSKLIKNSILQLGTNEQHSARISTMTNLATNQAILDTITNSITSQAEKIKAGIIGTDISSGSDIAVDVYNQIQYRIIQQERMIEQLENDSNTSSFQLKAAKLALAELEKQKSKFISDNPNSLENNKVDKYGLYAYENDAKNSNPNTLPYMLTLMKRAGYMNQAKTSGIQFGLLADTKNGLKNFLEHVEQDIVNPINSKLDIIEANDTEGTLGSSIIITTEDKNGNVVEQEITEGKEYITQANEINKVLGAQTIKTYNNNIIKVLKIDGDKITIRVNNDKSYILSKDQFSKIKKLTDLSTMTVEQRLYFKNRDIVFDLNVFGKTGKRHSIKGENATKDFSKAGINIKARFIIDSADTKALKIQYINPVTKKTETIPYDRAYLAKYGSGKFDLRSLPGEEEELERKTTERTANNLAIQLQIFNQRISDSQAKLEAAQATQDRNNENYDNLRQQLIDDRAELELVTEELEKYANKKGRRSTVHNNLLKLKGAIATRIQEAQDQIDSLKLERTNLEVLMEDIKNANLLYEAAIVELEVEQVPFDRQGRSNISGATQEEYDQSNKDQITRRLSSDRVDELLQDTQNEIDNLNSRINSLTNYISVLKDILRKSGIVSDYMDFIDLPESINTRKGFRDFLADKIANEPDGARKKEWQELYRQLQAGSGLKGDITFRDLMFLISGLRDSINDLNSAQNSLAEAEDKFNRLKEAQAQKYALSNIQDRIDYLNQVQQVLTQDISNIRPVVAIPVAEDVKPKDQEELSSDVEVSNDPYAPTFNNEQLPKFEEIGFNKTFGRQYSDDNDEVPITENGAQRFFQFTSSQNVANQDYDLQVINESNDTFGIRQEGFPNDLKLVVIKRTGDIVQYIGVDGNILEDPNKDNIIYTSMADINSWTVDRVRSSYSIANTTTDAQIQAVIDEHKQYQDILRSSIEPVYLKATSTSPGIQRVETLTSINNNGTREIAKAETEGRVIEDNPDWSDLKSANNPNVNIELRVSTANGAIAPGILPGRLVMQEFTYDGNAKLYGDKITRVFNRPLEETEKDTIIQVLSRMSELFGRKNTTDPDLKLSEGEQAELDLIQNYLRGIIAWGAPQNGSTSNTFMYIQNGLNRGELNIPFNTAAIQANQVILLDGMFHHVNNKAVKENSEYTTVKIVDGRVMPNKVYETYQEYLLAKRENGLVPPVYTSLPRVDSGIPQRTQSFINWIDPNVETTKIEVQREVDIKKQVVNTPVKQVVKNLSIQEQIESFLNYDQRSFTIKDVTVSYINKDGGVAIRMSKGDQERYSPIFSSKEDILANRSNIIDGIKQATGYNASSSTGLKALGTKAISESKSAAIQPVVPTGTLGGLRSLAQRTPAEQFQAAQEGTPVDTSNPAVANILAQNDNASSNPADVIDEATPPAPSVNGETRYTDVESAVMNAKPIKGFLSAQLWNHNIITDEWLVAAKGTVKIVDGNLKLAQKMLMSEIINNLPNDSEENFREVTTDEVEKLEDFKALESFMSENLPQIPVNKVSNLIAGKAWGQFLNGAIYIYENAELGTGFHEAFESVWGSFLTDADQEILSKEFRARDGQFTNPFTRETKNYKDASDYDVREMLSEEFRDHVLNDGNNLNNKSKIAKFFTQLWNAIKSILGLSPTTRADFNDNINRVFKKIGTGGFKRSTPITERAQTTPAYRIANLSSEESGSALEGLTYYFFLELFKDGKSIDTILNELTPETSKTFIGDLFAKAANRTIEDASIRSKRVGEILQNQRKELYNELKNNLTRYGLTFDEDVINKEESATDTLGIRDSISVNPQKMTGINVKLLLASLPNNKYNSNGKPVVIKNSLNQPSLIDYSKVHNMLLNELANIVPYYDAQGNRKEALDLMFEALDAKHKMYTGNYRPGYLWIKNLKLRLKYEDINGVKVPISSLNDDDIRLRIAFIKSFTNNKNLPEKTIIGEDGYLYNLNPINNVNNDRVKQNWLNNLINNYLDKKHNIIIVEPGGTRIFNRNGSDYKFLMDALNNKAKLDLDKAVDVLNKLGITFTSNKQQLNKYAAEIRENTIQILGLLQSGVINNVSDLYGSSKVNGRIDKFLALESRFTGEDNILSYLNSDGESQYSVGIPSLFGQMINILNSVDSLKGLVQTAPWLGTIDKNGEVVLFGYNANSELLRKGGRLFNSRGNRREGAPLNYHIISGLGTSDYEGKATAVLQFPERVANEIHYLMKNIVYSNINSDKNTEFGIGIPGDPLVSRGAITRLLYNDGDVSITNLYINHLTDEMYTALNNTINPSNIQYYKEQVENLGHFRDIIGKDMLNKFKEEVLEKKVYTTPNAHLEFIKDNRAELESIITAYIKNEAGKTMDFLQDLDIFEIDSKDGNTLYTTDAIDNEELRSFLGVPESQKVTRIIEGDKYERQGFTEANLRTLSAFLAVNKELLLTEQHKLIYGHPVFYKDLPKRANGATSTKEQMVEDREILNWMDDKMPRNDGKVRGDEIHQTFKTISFKDSNVVSQQFTNIAEGMYKDMNPSLVKDTSIEKYLGATFDEKGNMTGILTDLKNGEQVPTGALAPYAQLNEADAQAWGMPDIIRDMLYLSSKLTKEQDAQFNYEMAYEKLALSQRGRKYTDRELEDAQNIVDKGNPGYIFQVLKPQYFGYADDTSLMHPTFLKNSVQPKFFRHVEGTQFEELYLAAKDSKVDVIGFESGEKVGNVYSTGNEFTPLYDANGLVNVRRTAGGPKLQTDMAQQKLFSKFWGIQVEMSSKAKTSVVRGTQITKLIMVNSYENGAPINSKVGRLIDEYNDILIQMMQNSKKDLIKELGLIKTADGYETDNLDDLVNLLREEAIKRELPDNMIDGIASITNHDGSQSLKYKFDTLNNSSKIDNILNSIVDSRVISEKIHGKASVQVASTLYENNPRNYTYISNGNYTKLSKSKLKSLTPEEQKSIRPVSSDLKFYTNKNGVTTKMEVYVAFPFKDITPESLGLVLENGIYKPNNGVIDPRLLNSIGFRIPTQAMNSMENIIIKGFTPANNGDMIVVPSEIVGKSGSDFDIDKLNLYMANYIQDSTSGTLNYVEFKGDINSTREFYGELYDQGKLLSKSDKIQIDRFATDVARLYTTDSDWDAVNLLKSTDKLEDTLISKLSNLFTDVDMNEGFLEELLTEEGKKEKVLDQLVKKALQNHLMNIMGSILELNSNYRQLVTPNSVDTIKGLATEINKLKIAAGTKELQDEKSFNYLRTFIGSSNIRERYLTAKRMVGIAALHSTFHAMAQVSGTKLKGSFELKGIKFLAAPNEVLRTIDIKLNHNSRQSDGTYNIGGRLDADGNLISESGSEKLSGFVDGAKDPFVFDLNLNMNTASTWFYLDHHGVPQKDTAYFFNQPILDQFFSIQAKNRSAFKSINGKSKFPEALFYDAIRPYYNKLTGVDIVAELEELQSLPRNTFTPQQKLKTKLKQFLVENNAKYSKFTVTELRQAIIDGNNADPGLQLAVLYNYLELTTQGRFLSNYMQAIGYDNSKTKSIQENQMQVAKWNKAINDKFVANPEAILKTFIGEMKTQKEDVFNMFRNFFVTMSPKVQKVFAPIVEQLSDPDFFTTKNDAAVLLQRYQNFVLSYILHTTNYNNGLVDTKIQDKYNLLFGEASFPRLLAKIKVSTDPTVSDNLIIRELLPLLTEDENKTDNISLFRNRLDTFDINKLTEALTELRDYAIDIADNELLSFVDNLTTFSIIQSGTQASTMNFSTVLPTAIYSEQVNKIISNFIESEDDIDTEDLWYNFHANQWQNTSVVPRAPKWLKVKNGTILVGENSSTAANQYISKTVVRQGVNKNQVKQLIKDKKFQEAFDTLLFERSEPNGNGKIVYRAINKKGAGPRFTEISIKSIASIMPINTNVTTIGSGSSMGDGFFKVSPEVLNKIMGEGFANVTDNTTVFNDAPPADLFLDPQDNNPGISEIDNVLKDKDQNCKE